MSRTFTIKELNEKIDKLLLDYQSDLYEYLHEIDDEEEQNIIKGKIQALYDLKLELNSPEPLVNVTEKIQESLNIIETNKIIKDGL